MTARRAALVAAAEASIAKGSKSFAMASRLFDRTTRERAWLLYAWCRRCDDLADGQDGGGEREAVTDPDARIALIRMLTAQALDRIETGDAAFDALGLVVREVTMPRRFIEDHIAGFALDTQGWRPRSEDDLLRYCYHVAGVVGCMMAVVMGVDPADDATLDRACDLGLAFQLANIARDIGEDDAAGRCYLPADWLEDLSIGQDTVMAPQHRYGLAVIARRLARSVELYEASARVGATRLGFRSRWAVLSAAGIYGDIAREVDRRGNAAWDERVFISSSAKLAWAVHALVQSSINRPKLVDRSGLWTRSCND